MTNIHQSILLDGDRLFTEFKGALTEQYVLQQLKTRAASTYTIGAPSVHPPKLIS